MRLRINVFLILNTNSSSVPLLTFHRVFDFIVLHCLFLVCQPSVRLCVKVTDCMPEVSVSVSEVGKVRNVRRPPQTAKTPAAVVMEYAWRVFASVLLDTPD